MTHGELTVQKLCDILEGQGVLSTQERIRVEGRSGAQRAKLEELQAARPTSERRGASAVDAIDIVTSMGVPNASSPGLMVSDLAVAEAIAAHGGLRFMRFTGDAVDRELAASTLSRPFALRHCVMPVGRRGETLILAVATPLAEDVLGELRRKSGAELELVISPKSDIRNAIHQVFGASPSEVPAPRTTSPPGPGGRAASKRAPGLPLWVIVGGAAALVVALGLLAAALVCAARAGDTNAPDEELGDESVSPEGAAAGGGAGPAKASPRGGGGRLQVRVTLRGVPAGAAISLDGERIDRTTLNVLNDGRAHEIEVRAMGHDPWLRTVTPTADEEIDVGMVPPAPASGAEPRPVPRQPGTRDAVDAPPQPSQPPSPLVRDPGF